MNKKNLAKRLFAGVAALALSAVCAVPALATDSTDASFTKTYTITNVGTTSPKETFTFKFEADKVEGNSALTKSDMPSIGDAEVSYDAGDATTSGLEKSVNVELSDVVWPGVGVYYYKVTEVAGTTAGVVYDDATAYLKVTVANDTSSGTYYVAFVTLNLADEDGDEITDTKTGGFTNEYKAAGVQENNQGIQISKYVTGSFGDKTKYFKVAVTLNSESGKTGYAESYAVKGGSSSSNPTSIKLDTVTYFYIKDGETLTIEDVPYGVTYTVVEADYKTNDGYDNAEYSVNGATATTDSVSGEKVDSATETVAITNNKGGTVDTGIVTNNIPFIVMGVAAVAGLAVVAVRRRSNEQ